MQKTTIISSHALDGDAVVEFNPKILSRWRKTLLKQTLERILVIYVEKKRGDLRDWISTLSRKTGLLLNCTKCHDYLKKEQCYYKRFALFIAKLHILITKHKPQIFSIFFSVIKLRCENHSIIVQVV